MSRKNRTLEEQIDAACQSVLLRIPKRLHCEDLYQDIACIYLDISNKYPDLKHALICNKIYQQYIDMLIDKYKNDKCGYTILPRYLIEDEDDMMFIIADILKTIKSFLTEREFDIICRKYIDNEKLKDISDAHNICRQYINYIAAKSIRRLRHPTRSKLIRDFYR